MYSCAYHMSTKYEWDSEKARRNRLKHTVGEDARGRLLVTVYTFRGERVRMISARRATLSEYSSVRGRLMRKEYDFSKGKRGPVVRVSKGKTRITIRFDDDVLAWFREQVERAGGGSYQQLMNQALREYIDATSEPTLEATLRRVVREEMERVG